MKKGALSLLEWCKREQKPQLLSLYDCEKNSLSPSEIAFSSPKKYQFRCPVCGISWEQKPNKLNQFRAGSYNVIKKQPEVTFCPYCKG